MLEYVDGNYSVTEYEYDNAGNVTKLSNSNSSNKYTYNGAGYLSVIEHNGFQYNFNYDVLGNLISTKIGDTALSTNTYSSTNGNLTKTTYANGDYIEYTYDDYDNITQLKDENGVFAQFVYNKKGLVSKAIDSSSGTTTYYYYDFSGAVAGEYRQNSNTGALSYYISYDKNGNKVEKTAVGDKVKTITTGTDEDGNSFVSNDGVKVKSKTDDFGRTTKVTTSNSEDNIELNAEYSYANVYGTKAETNLVDRLTQKLGDNTLVSYEYDYDGNNNIISVESNGTSLVEYEYDELNQLHREIDKTNRTYTYYYYDNGGNIISVEKYGYDSASSIPSTFLGEDTYEYDTTWKDKLIKYNGTSITYDEMGNPLSYRDGMSFEWERGRILSSVTKDNTTIEMKYDSNGMRTQKGDVHYYYDSNNNLIALVNSFSTLFFYYDENGSPVSFSYNGIGMYYYVKNLQGDIVKIVNKDGQVVASYEYNAWGEILSIKNYYGSNVTDPNHIGLLNPFRYRGYVYDDETGLYYLQSRYYDPITGRFLNTDIYFDTVSGSPLSTNMYTYCENNMVMKYDYTGEDAWWIQDSASVWTMGHVSLLIQEAKGRWWYFYWGDLSVQLIYIGTCTLDSLNSYLKNHYYINADGKKVSYYEGQNYFGNKTGYNRKLVFKGDFTQSLKYILNTLLNRQELTSVILNYKNPKYDVFNNNCMQVSIDALLKGKFSFYDSRYKSGLKSLRDGCPVPNASYVVLKNFHNSLILLNAAHKAISATLSALNKLKNDIKNKKNKK